jgi:hypothetical protein
MVSCGTARTADLCEIPAAIRYAAQRLQVREPTSGQNIHDRHEEMRSVVALIAECCRPQTGLAEHESPCAASVVDPERIALERNSDSSAR